MELGVFVYRLYRALTYGISPLIHLHIRWRRLRGVEHFRRWPERFGRPSVLRPPGSLVWFHAVSLGEGMAAIPRCNEMKPDMTILMTTTTVSAFEVIKNQLPIGVLHQLKLSELETACEDFSNIVGSTPSDATICKGTLSTGSEIAVLSIASGSLQDWSADLETQIQEKIQRLSQVDHKNFSECNRILPVKTTLPNSTS